MLCRGAVNPHPADGIFGLEVARGRHGEFRAAWLGAEVVSVPRLLQRESSCRRIDLHPAHGIPLNRGHACFGYRLHAVVRGKQREFSVEVPATGRSRLRLTTHRFERVLRHHAGDCRIERTPRNRAVSSPSFARPMRMGTLPAAASEARKANDFTATDARAGPSMASSACHASGPTPRLRARTGPSSDGHPKRDAATRTCIGHSATGVGSLGIQRRLALCTVSPAPASARARGKERTLQSLHHPR